jgi:hypothetical protein
MGLLEHLQTSFAAAEEEHSKLTQDVLDLEGMSGNMTRHFYNNLMSKEDIRYLEIGSWLGSSLCSAMYENKATIFCIDNWSEDFHGTKTVKEDFLTNLKRFQGENSVQVLEAECFSVDVSTLPKFNVYLYDGAHTKEDHKKALLHYYDCLDDEFIFLCDDWNWPAVREGTIEAVQELNLQVLCSIERACQKDDPIPIPYHYGKATWWNGIWAALLKKTK